MIICILSKFLIIKFILILIIEYYNNLKINENYIKSQLTLNITFQIKIKHKIRIGIYTFCMKNGGRARISAILINLLNKMNIFNIYLYTQKPIENNEYKIPKNIKRFVIKNNNITKIFKNKINILIFQLISLKKIKALNKYKKIKVIYFLHNSIFNFIYSNFTHFKKLYKEYSKSNYIISLIPLENDYLFQKWGINSILMNNFMTYNYNYIIPSTLSSKTILMIGRGNDKNKRFEKGIRSMEYIIKEIQECELIIISKLHSINNLLNLVVNLNLTNIIKFEGFNDNPEIFFENSSLHIFPSLTESFGLVLSETKIYGIPNILLGLDYVSIAQNGTIIIYDDTPESIAIEAIKILLDIKFRINLGKNSRQNMKQYNNELIIKKWVKIILTIYNNDLYFEVLKKQNKKISEKEGIHLLNRQIQILKLRDKTFKELTLTFKVFTD